MPFANMRRATDSLSLRPPMLSRSRVKIHPLLPFNSCPLMNSRVSHYREILLICFAGALLAFAQPALSQQAGLRPLPDRATSTAAAQATEKEVQESKTTGKKDRFTYGKRHETSVATESTDKIQKTKHGSSDATVPTGVFKESFLDVGLSSGRAAAASPTPKAQINPVRSTTNATATLPSASPQPSPSPAAALTSPANVDITLGVSPAPTALATPKSH